MNVYSMMPVRKTGIDMKNPLTAHVRLALDFSRYLLSRPSNMGERSSLTANKNCMAQTSRQHRFSESERAHSARVTSYTIIKSSLLKLRVSASSRLFGEIFSRKISDSSANSKETERERVSESEVSVREAERRHL